MTNNQAGGGSPWPQEIAIGVQKVWGDLHCSTGIIREDISRLEKKVDSATRKPRKSVLNHELADLPAGEIAVVKNYSDRTREVVACLAGISGPCRAYRFEVIEEDWDTGLFGLYFEGSQEWIVGRIEKLGNSAYLYNLFQRFGIRFKGQITRSNAKQVLNEAYMPEIYMTQNTVTISALAGWEGKNFQCRENYILSILDDVIDFPVHKKGFLELDFSDDTARKYFEEMRRIKDGDDRMMMMTYPFLSMISSILSENGHPLNFGINIIKLSSIQKPKVSSWLQVFNREFCNPISCDLSERQFEQEMRMIKDEVVVVDCEEYDSDENYLRKKKRRLRDKFFRVILDEKRVKERTRKPICAGICTISSQFHMGKAVYNIFADDEWYQPADDDFVTSKVMERIFTAFRKYVEENMDEILAVIRTNYGWEDEREAMFFKGYIITEKFWKSRGINFLKESGIEGPMEFGSFFAEHSYDEEEMIRFFVEHFRKGAGRYRFLPRSVAKSGSGREILYDEEWLFVPTTVMKCIMNGVAKGRERDKLLLKLKELEFMKTDAEGLSRRIEIAEKKQEVYQIRKSLFNEAGKADIISLGGGEHVVRPRRSPIKPCR